MLTGVDDGVGGPEGGVEEVTLDRKDGPDMDLIQHALQLLATPTISMDSRQTFSQACCSAPQPCPAPTLALAGSLGVMVVGTLLLAPSRSALAPYSLKRHAHGSEVPANRVMSLSTMSAPVT